MSIWAKYLIGLTLALPMGAYVAGSLMASATDHPVNHDPVRIQDAPSESTQDGDGRTPRPSKQPDREPSRSPDAATEDDDDDDLPDDDDDTGVRVVTPEPTRLDDGDDNDDGGGQAGDDRDDGDDDEDESRDRSRDGSRDD